MIVRVDDIKTIDAELFIKLSAPLHSTTLKHMSTLSMFTPKSFLP